MQEDRSLKTIWISFGIWAIAAAALLLMDLLIPNLLTLTTGWTIPGLLGYLAAIMGGVTLLKLLTYWGIARSGKPQVEGKMLGGLYQLLAILGVALTAAYALGRLSSVGEFFTLFGGLILGWSLQAPVSGFAAWALVSAKRPFRPGDRVQFPNLGLTGDVHDVGLMYTVLNQVGGTIGSEEAVGRYILVPNAMLFSQVAINYTVLQDAPYMLDEVVVRITYDSDWAAAERVMLQAARQVTADVIQATGEEPYIRSDLYDYGVYLRLRYRTPVKRRAETTYEINRLIFNSIQCTPSIDLAIPYIYSYRSGVDRREELAGHDKELDRVREIPVDRIRTADLPVDARDVEQLADSIAARGLLQPIVVVEAPDGYYDVVAGPLRFEACKHLGWKTIPAEVRATPRGEEPEPAAG